MNIVASDLEKEMIHSRFGRLDIEQLENDKIHLFQVALLDVFPKRLSVKEASQMLGNAHQMKHELKFLKFFEACYHTFGDPFFVYQSEGQQLLKINTFKDLVPFIQSVRDENIFYNFFLPEIGIVIVGNYDWTLPVYTLTREAMNKIEHIAHQTALFLR